jgi:Domain of unknown function (DUF4386)
MYESLETRKMAMTDLTQLPHNATCAQPVESQHHRAAATSVALLFLTSTITFVIGSARIDDYFADASSNDRSQLILGVILECYTGMAVAAIGFIVLPILRPFGKRLAQGYVALRSLEALSIIAIGTYFITSRKYLDNYDSIIYVATGIGGLMLSVLLYRSQLVPRWLSTLGIAGYALLLLGVVGVALDMVDFETTGGTMFFSLGGLFEVLLPLVLLVRGFRR